MKYNITFRVSWMKTWSLTLLEGTWTGGVTEQCPEENTESYEKINKAMVEKIT